MKFISAILAAGLLCLLATGCSSVVGIAPSTTPITADDTYTVIGKAKGTSRGIVWFCIPTFPVAPSKEARDKALKSMDADALIEVTEEYKTLSLIIVSFAWTNVEGTAIKMKRGGAEGDK